MMTEETARELIRAAKECADVVNSVGIEGVHMSRTELRAIVKDARKAVAEAERELAGTP